MAPVRPESVEEEERVVDALRVGVEVVDFDAVVRAERRPVANLLGVGDEGETPLRFGAREELAERHGRTVLRVEAGDDEGALVAGRAQLAAGHEEDAVAHAGEGRGRGVDVARRVLRHDDEVESVSARGRDYLLGPAFGVSAEK